MVGDHADRAAQVSGDASGDAAVDADTLDGVGIHSGHRQSVDRLEFGRRNSAFTEP